MTKKKKKNKRFSVGRGYEPEDFDFDEDVEKGRLGFDPQGKLAMYSNLLMDWMAGAGIDQATKLSDVSIETRFDRIRTANGSTQFWVVHGIPVSYEKPFVMALRRHMFKVYPNVEIKVATHAYPVTHELNVRSDYFKGRMAATETRYTLQQEILETGSETDMVTGRTIQKFGSKLRISPEDVRRNEELFRSYQYVYERVSDNDGAVFQSYIVISANMKMMSRKESREFDKALQDYLGNRRQGMFYHKVTGKVKTLLSAFGVTGSFSKDLREQFDFNLLTDENLATLTTFSNYGLQGGRGYMFGMDIRNSNPFILPVTETGDRQVWLCVAPPGGSKTYLFGNGAVFGALANNHHISVFDIKGHEYDPLMQFCSSLKLDFSAKSGNFVNTLRLDDLPPMTKQEYFEAYLDAVNSTIGWLVTMTDLKEEEGNVTDLEEFLSNVIESYYATQKVNPHNPKTFINSKDMKIKDLPRYMNLVQEGLNPDSLQRKVAIVAIERCVRSLSGESDFGNMFKHEVTISDVLSSQLMVYSFGLNAGDYLGIEAGIKAHMANAIDTKKEYYRKRDKKFTTVMYEELNSTRYIPGFVRQVSNRVVRSRSNNLNIGLIMNSPQVLKEPEFADIASNLSMVIAGALVPADLEVLEHIGAEKLIPECTRMQQSETELYKHVFAVQFETSTSRGVTLIKAEYPHDIHKLLETRTVIDAT